jgi:hypothetical protein
MFFLVSLTYSRRNLLELLLCPLELGLLLLLLLRVGGGALTIAA